MTHEPVYGVGKGPTEGQHLRRVVRLYDLLREVKRIQPKSVLDVGAAEGYFPAMVKEALGIPAVALDTSVGACSIASGMLGVPSIAANASALPFPDNAFDVVTMAEVVEHLSDPVGAFLEAQRVAKRFVVISTEEWSPSLAQRQHILRNRRPDAHMEKNIFCPEDLATLFGESNFCFRSQRFLAAGYDPLEAEASLEKLKAVLHSDEHHVEGGVIIVAATNAEEALVTDLPEFDEAIVDLLWKGLVDLESPKFHEGSNFPSNLACPQCKVAIPNPEFSRCSRCEADFERGCSEIEGVANLYFYRDPSESLDSLATHLGIEGTRKKALRELDQEFSLPSPEFDQRFTAKDYSVIPSDWEMNDIEIDQNGWYRGTSDDPQIVSSLLCLKMSVGMECQIDIEFETQQGERFAEFFLLGDDAFHFEQKFSTGKVIRLGTKKIHAISFKLPSGMYRSGHYLMRVRIDPTFIPGDRFRIHSLRIEDFNSESGERGKAEQSFGA